MSATNEADADRFGLRCKYCGHVTYFKKSVVCVDETLRWRGEPPRGEAGTQDLLLECENCHEKNVVPVDCRGYQ